MARRKRDLKYLGFLRRIRYAIEDPDFSELAIRIKWQIEQQEKQVGIILLPEEDRNIQWDDEKECWVYSGLYYDVRELCDLGGLNWSTDGKYLFRLLLCDTDEQVNNVLKPDICPPDNYWQWYRMARRGLGIVRADDLRQDPKGITISKKTAHGRTRCLESGLPYDMLAQIAGVDERTIQNAIKACEEYASHCNTRKIAELAHLSPSEELMLRARRGEVLLKKVEK